MMRSAPSPGPPPWAIGWPDAAHPGRRRERGVALVLVLVILPLVAIIMTQLSFETAIGDRLARNGLANAQFKGAIRARLAQMRLFLVRDLKEDEKGAAEGGAFDHYGDVWGPQSEGGDVAVMVQKGDAERGDDITLYTEVVDEQGKFNLNLLTHKDPQRAARALEVFKNLLDFYRDPRFGDFAKEHEYDLDDQEARAVGDAVMKFLKGDERDARVHKPQLPDPTNDMRQGTFTVRDLAFSHQLFFEKRLLSRFTDVESGQVLPSLEEFVTIYGDGRVNVNTAPIQVLRAMFKEEEGQRQVAEAILHGRGGFLETDEDREKRKETLDERRKAREEGRGEEEQPEEEVAAYKSLNDLAKVEGMGDGAFLRRNDVDVGRDFTVRTNHFRIVVTAKRENFLRRQVTVLERHADGCLSHASEVRFVDATDLPEDAMRTGPAAGEAASPGP
jgi:type II secretory pathway component PulK